MNLNSSDEAYWESIYQEWEKEHYHTQESMGVPPLYNRAPVSEFPELMALGNKLARKLTPLIPQLTGRSYSLFYVNPEPDSIDIEDSRALNAYMARYFLYVPATGINFSIYSAYLEYHRDTDRLPEPDGPIYIHFCVEGYGEPHSLFTSWEETVVGAKFKLVDGNLQFERAYVAGQVDHQFVYQEKPLAEEDYRKVLELLNEVCESDSVNQVTLPLDLEQVAYYT